MAKDLGELLVKLGADIGELKSGLNAARSEMASFKAQVTSFGESVKKALAFAGVAVGLWEIAGALKEFATNAALVGARTETLGIAMRKIGENSGLSADVLNFYVNQLKKAGITTQESMSAISTATVSGVDLRQLQALATRARDVAVLAGKNTSETLQTIMHALVSRQMEMIRNLNVPMANYEDVVKKITQGLNIDKDQIDRVTMVNALLKEFMEASKGAAGAAEAAEKSVDKQIKSMTRYAEEAKNSLWTFFQPIMQTGVQALSSWWQGMEKWAKDNEEALRSFGETIGEVMKKKLELVTAIVKWVVANGELLASVLKLYGIYKLVGYATALSAAFLGAAASAGVATTSLTALKAAIAGGPWTVVITIALVGLSAALAGINMVRQAAQLSAAKGTGAIDTRTNQPVGLGQVPDIGKKEDIMGAPRQMTAEETKIFDQAFPSPPKKDPDKAVADATKAAQQAADALEKKRKEAQGQLPPAKGGGGGGGAKEKPPEDFTRLIEKELKAQLDLEITKQDEQLKILKANHEKRKALLKQEFEEGKLDAREYYAALEQMENEDYQKSIDLVQKKIDEEKKLYPAQIQAIQDSNKLSPEAKALEIEAMRLEHEARLVKLQGERQLLGIEHEKKIADLLKDQLDNREKITDLMAQAAEDNALGPIAEKEAEINRLLREREKLRKTIPNDLKDQFDQDTQGLVWKKTIGEEVSGWASAISNGFKNLFSSIADGTTTLKKAVNTFFKSLFDQSLEQGFKQLTQWITNALKEMFGTMGSGLASAALGVIGLIGMMLTSGSDTSSWSASGATTGVTNTSTALRGVVAGESSIAIGEIGDSLADALLPTERYLATIARNTGLMAGNSSSGIDSATIAGVIKTALDEYFRQALVMGAR